METSTAIQALFSLIFVIALIGISAYIFQRLSISKTFLNKNLEKRLKLLDFLMIDSKRKIMVVENGDEEVTILIGVNDEKIISVDKKTKKSPKK